MKIIRNSAPAVLLSISMFLAIYQLCQSFFVMRDTGSSQEMVTKWEAHIQPLREALPSDIVTIGYLDKSIILANPNLFDVEEFLLMQYSVAPLILKTGTDPKWIIGNFDNHTEFQTWLDRNIGSYEIQSFGFGLHLIQKTKYMP